MTKRYLIASALLLAVMMSNSFYGNWIGDFWEHSAVVKELSIHPIHPRHPLLKVDKAHPFFSPYLLFVGLFSRFASLSPIDALAISGILNLLLLLIGFRRFIHCFFDKNQDAIGFYALFFILFLWSSSAWAWSGFVNFIALSLGNVLPYPSTFAIAITFLIFPIYYEAFQSLPKILLCGALTALVILTHPTTGVFAILGLCAITLEKFKRIGFRAVITGAIVFCGSVSSAFLWPYYSFWNLISANNPEFHITSYRLYEAFFICFWPIILISPFAFSLLLSRLKKNNFDAIAFMLGFCIIVYLLGYFTGMYGIGRIISFIAIIIQVLFSAWVVKLKSDTEIRESFYSCLIIIIFMGLVTLNYNNLYAFKRAFKGFQGVRRSYTEYKYLEHHIDQYDVVLADLDTSWKIPTFGGKVIASMHPIHWIDDHMKRRYDLGRFFSMKETQTEKFAIIERYKADYILINKRKQKDIKGYSLFGNLVFENNTFLLIKCLDNLKDMKQ